jgi:hypothetical protein
MMFDLETLAAINKERLRLAELGIPERFALENVKKPCISNAEQRRRDHYLKQKAVQRGNNGLAT